MLIESLLGSFVGQNAEAMLTCPGFFAALFGHQSTFRGKPHASDCVVPRESSQNFDIDQPEDTTPAFAPKEGGRLRYLSSVKEPMPSSYRSSSVRPNRSVALSRFGSKGTSRIAAQSSFFLESAPCPKLSCF